MNNNIDKECVWFYDAKTLTIKTSCGVSKAPTIDAETYLNSIDKCPKCKKPIKIKGDK